MTVPALGHVADRMRERYGIDLTGAELTQMLLDIMDAVTGVRQEAVLRSKQPDGKEWWYVTVQRQRVTVVYNPADAYIVTALPKAGYGTKANIDKQRAFGRERRVRRERMEAIDAG